MCTIGLIFYVAGRFICIDGRIHLTISTSRGGLSGHVDYESIALKQSELRIPDSPVILVIDGDSLFSPPLVSTLDLLRS